jgi:hypothetical protein
VSAPSPLLFYNLIFSNVPWASARRRAWKGLNAFIKTFGTSVYCAFIYFKRISKNPLITWAKVAPQILNNNGSIVTAPWQEIAVSSLCVFLRAALCSPERSYIFRVKESELKSSRRGAMPCTVLVSRRGHYVAHKEKRSVCWEGSTTRPCCTQYTPFYPCLSQWTWPDPLRILLRAARSKCTDCSKVGIVCLAQKDLAIFFPSLVNYFDTLKERLIGHKM